MKKLLTLIVAALLAVTTCLGLVACGESEGEKVKVGLITLHGTDSTYDKNFIDAFEAACTVKGVQAVIKTNIDEKQICYDTACDLAEEGCKLVFADSFGHEAFMKQAAQAFKDVQFCHATGTSAKTAGIANFHNAFASIYEGRYLAGVAAGLKLVEMYNADNSIAVNGTIKVGYVGAFPYAEVKSGYTAWFLGVRNTVQETYPDLDVTMDVEFTNEWYHETLETNAATSLIASGCVLVSQHADSWGAPTVCETKGVPNVSYNGSTASRCPNTFIVSSKINWQPYFEYIIDCVLNNKTIDTDWSEGFGSTFYNGSVCLSELGNAAAAGTQAKLEQVAAGLKNGTVKVFDTSKFTVSAYAGGAFAELTDVVLTNGTLTSAKQGGKEIIKSVNGVTFFDESNADTNRSAPYFDIDIDGITPIYKAE